MAQFGTSSKLFGFWFSNVLSVLNFGGRFVVVRFIALLRSENKSTTGNEWFPYYKRKQTSLI